MLDREKLHQVASRAREMASFCSDPGMKNAWVATASEIMGALSTSGSRSYVSERDIACARALLIANVAPIDYIAKHLKVGRPRLHAEVLRLRANGDLPRDAYPTVVDGGSDLP